MTNSHKLGIRGEDLAADYLICNGYTIRDRNYRYLKAEIDIIAQKDNLLAIVEVKSRNSRFYKDLSETISNKKKGLLIMATDYYVRKNQLEVEVRFDIITVIKGSHEYRIDHIPDAFYHF